MQFQHTFYNAHCLKCMTTKPLKHTASPSCHPLIHIQFTFTHTHTHTHTTHCMNACWHADDLNQMLVRLEQAVDSEKSCSVARQILEFLESHMSDFRMQQSIARNVDPVLRTFQQTIQDRCVCACVCVRVSVCMCVCACVHTRVCT